MHNQQQQQQQKQQQQQLQRSFMAIMEHHSSVCRLLQLL
jgi:hypothetical protein